MKKIVIAIIGDKGGIGKTLFGYNITYRAYQDEPSCELIDCDNDQYSSSDFAKDRITAGLKPLPVVNVATKNLRQYLVSEKSKNIKLSFIEFGKAFGEDDAARREALELAVKVSDIVFSIMQASPVDARAFGKFEDNLPSEIKNIPAYLIVNRVKSKKRLKSVLEAAPDLKYFKLTESYLGDRLCYQDSFGDSGKSIFEIEAKDKSIKEAQKEFEQLYKEIIKKICH